MRLTIKRMAKAIGILLLVVLIGGGTWFTKPWDDLQAWRWYTMPFEGLRANIFTHWEVIQPVALLQASTNPRQYQRNVSSLESVSYMIGNERIPLTAYLEKTNISGLMVLQDGEIKLEYYAKGLNAESRNHIWSATKSFTSTLVAMAHFEGRIESLDDKVERYAPQFAGTAYGDTSIRHVLMMSSGIDFFHFKGTPNRNNMYWDIMQERQDFDAWAAALGHCCLSLRLEEFAHLGQLYVENLVMEGEPTVRTEWLSMVKHPQAPFQEPSVDEAGATGQPMLLTEGESGAGPGEFAAVMWALASSETFQ